MTSIDNFAVGEGQPATADKASLNVPSQSHDEEGQVRFADKAIMRMPTSSPQSRAGQKDFADKAERPMPVSAPNDEEGRFHRADKALTPVPTSSALDALAELQVRRKFYIGVVNKQTNALKALVRRSLGWRYDDEETGREKVNARAARIVAAGLSGKPQKPEDEQISQALAIDLAVLSAALVPCTNARHDIELEMKRIVRTLPIYAWAKEVKGLGDLGLAVIIAEAGDLSGYPKKGHLWKRLGLAPFDGKAYSTWRREGGLTAEDWTTAGYSPRRRAELYAVISDPLSKSQIKAKDKSVGKHGDPLGPYGEIYVRRQFKTDETHPDWTLMHKRMDALRVMTKYLLRDLWREWNGRKAIDPMPVRAVGPLPTVHPVAAE